MRNWSFLHFSVWLQSAQVVDMDWWRWWRKKRAYKFLNLILKNLRQNPYNEFIVVFKNVWHSFFFIHSKINFSFAQIWTLYCYRIEVKLWYNWVVFMYLTLFFPLPKGSSSPTWANFKLLDRFLWNLILYGPWIWWNQLSLNYGRDSQIFL